MRRTCLKVEVIGKRMEKLKVIPESEEDLWTLKTVLRPGDYVRAKTVREVAFKGRGEKERKPIIVKLRIKNIEFQPFTGKLRIFGVIVEGPEEYGLKGKHQSILVVPGKLIEIERTQGWSRNIIEKLKSSGPKGKAIIVAIDYDEYGIAVLSTHGFRMIVEESIRLPGKDDPSRETLLEKYIDNIAKKIIETAKKYDVSLVIIAGPGVLKNKLAEKVKVLMPNLKIAIDNVSMGGRTGIEEVLRRQTVANLLKEYAVAHAEQVYEKIMREASRDPNRVVYGLDEVFDASLLGAVDELIMIDSLLYSMDEEESRKASEIMEAVEKYRGKIYLVPENSPIGEKLASLGGIIAYLRYSLKKAQ